MIRFIFLRFLVLFLVCYVSYLLFVRSKKKEQEQRVVESEKTDYDEQEWERIKKELED